MIAPALDSRALIARLDAAPARLRTALSLALDRALHSRLGPHLSATIDTTANTVTATIETARLPPAHPRAPARNKISERQGRGGHGKDAPRDFAVFQQLRSHRVLRASFAPFALTNFSSISTPEIRAALEAAAQQALDA